MTPLLLSYSNSGRHWLMSIFHNCNIKCHKTLVGSNAVEAIPHQRLIEYYEKTMSPDKFKDYNIIFLHRDPRDVVVSNYYHCIYLAKMQNFNKEISKFIRDDISGIEKIIKFNLFWKEFKIEKKVLTYESMHLDIFNQIKNIIDIDSDTLKAAIELSSFENMKQNEIKNYPNKTLNEMKVRKGIVGEYINELCEADIDYCNNLLNSYNYFERMK
jgi:hypothetical protein